MKKIVVIAFVSLAVFAACKKDRVCSCKAITNYSGGPLAGTVGQDYEYTMVKASYKDAYYHCTHKKSSDTIGTVTVTYDENCSLK